MGFENSRQNVIEAELQEKIDNDSFEKDIAITFETFHRRLSTFYVTINQSTDLYIAGLKRDPLFKYICKIDDVTRKQYCYNLYTNHELIADIEQYYILLEKEKDEKK